MNAVPDATEPGPVAALAALWPPEEARRTEVYAVLDGARDRRIETLAGLWGRDPVCLFGDTLSAELRNAAPWLVRLDGDGAVGEALVRRAWGNAWGVFVVAPTGTGTRRMVRAFKRLTRVLDAEGNLMMFRFYDPRVLPIILPVLEPEQESEIFGPAIRYVAEDAAGMPLVFERRFPVRG